MGATDSNYRIKKEVVTKKAPKDWSNLHQDIIDSFAEKIVSMKDFFAFGGVSKSWRSAAVKENSNKGLRLQHQVPALLLSKEINAPIRNCYSLTKGQIYQLDLPETTGKFCYSSLGWLLTISYYFPKYSSIVPTHLRYIFPRTKEIILFNPLTHAQIKLPLLPSKIMSPDNITKFVLSSSPSWTSEYRVMVLSNDGVAFYKPGYNNDKWALIPSPPPWPVILLADVIYHKGRIYTVDFLGRVFVCETEDPNNIHMRFVAPAIPSEQLFGPDIHFKSPCLVESSTRILLLVIFLFDKDCELTNIGCKVFKVPFDDDNSWERSEVRNLGNDTLFLGANNSSFSIETLDDSICKTNCIYFLNRSHVSRRGDIDIGIYYMKDGKIDRHLETLFPDVLDEEIYLTSHAWLQPSF